MIVNNVMRAALLLVAGGLAVDAASQEVQKRDYPGVRNFSRVDATIACGGATTPEAMAALRKDGFVSLICGRPRDRREPRRVPRRGRYAGVATLPSVQILPRRH